MQKHLFLILALIFLSRPLWADPVMPPLAEYKHASAKIAAINKETRQPIWTESESFFTGIQNGQSYLTIKMEGQGYFGGSKSLIRWKVLSYYFYQPNLRPYYSKWEVFSQDNQLINTETCYYDWTDKKLYFTRVDKVGNNSIKKILDLEGENIVDRFALTFRVMSFFSSHQSKLDLYYVSSDPKIYSISLIKRGKEIIPFNGKALDCEKIEMKVNLGALEIINAFLPRNYFWFSYAQPPEFVAYDGMDGGLGTPPVVVHPVERMVYSR